jgi:CubicO group peptidase (beta-lactamase class C family)
VRQFIIAAIIFLAAAAQPARAVAAPVDFARGVDAIVESNWKADRPGAAIIVVQNGKTIYLRGLGLADLATRVPIKPDTVFRLGSITKQFTAAAVLKLAEEGRLSLDVPSPGIYPPSQGLLRARRYASCLITPRAFPHPG